MKSTKMCGRFTAQSKIDLHKQIQRLNRAPEVKPRYNIAPSQQILAVREVPKGNDREWVHLRWGLIPSWAKDAKIGNKLINARSETIFEKPSFRGAVKKRRCIIPADGYYEWKKEGKSRQPYHFHRKDGEPFWMAGLWEHWRFEEQDMDIESCTIVTTSANKFVQKFHDRMPVILGPEQCEIWLDQTISDQEKLAGLFAPYPAEELTAKAVSTLVNKAAYDGPECLEPVAEESTLF